MKISVIVPIYNSENYLERCINSLLKQTYKDIEIILINDGSTDRSGEICNKYNKIDDRVKVQHIENSGVSKARNIGLQMATGDYITFMDSDDYIKPNTYKDIVEIILRDQIDIIKYNYYRTTGLLKLKNQFSFPTSCVINIEQNKDKIIKSFFENHDFASVWNAVIKKNIIENIRFDEKLTNSEDRLFMSTITLKANTVFFVNKGFYYYFMHKKSKTNTFDYEKCKKLLINNVKVKKEIYDYIDNKQYEQAFINGVIFDIKGFIINQIKIDNYEQYQTQLKKIIEQGFIKLENSQIEEIKQKLFQCNTYKKIKQQQYILKIKRGLIS